jgi:hypothetical protein
VNFVNLSKGLPMVGSTATAPQAALLHPELDMAEYGRPNFFRYVNRCLFQSGYIVLRNAIDRNRCAIFHRLVGRTHDHLRAKLRAKGIDIDGLLPEDKLKGAWHEIGWDLRNGQITPPVFGLANPGLALDDVIAGLNFYSLLQNFFADAFRPSGGCKAQRIDPASVKPAIRWRSDAQHYGAGAFGLTIWVPLEDCGIDAPGIQFAPGNHHCVQQLLKYDPAEPGACDPAGTAMIEDGRYVRNMYGGAVSQPEFLAGDVAIFTNWTVHATHVTDKMTKLRQSVECRYMSEKFAFPNCAL